MRLVPLAGSPSRRRRLWGFNYPVQEKYEPTWPLWRKAVRRFKACQVMFNALCAVPWFRSEGLVARSLRVGERIVEVPFVIRHVDDNERLILDIGCSESVLPLELAHLGFKVWGIDQRPYPLTHPNLRFVRGDCCQMCFPSGGFDVAISLSTLEHVGLGAYGDPRHEAGDEAAAREILRVLKPGGKLIITAPFGRACTTWQRVYDSAGLAKLVSGFHVEEIQHYRADGDAWLRVAEHEALQADSSRETRAVALLVARKSSASAPLRTPV
jgi:SAM-dependent methyltransferase